MTPNAGPVRRRGSAATPLKALSLLDIVAASDRGLNFTDLLQASGLPKPTLHRMLQTLLESGLVRLRPADRTYAIGLKVLDLARRLRRDSEIRAAAQPSLAEVSAITGEATNLALLDGLHVAYADGHRTSQAIRTYYAADRRLPLHCSAVGKAILAFLDPQSAAAILGRLDLTAYTSATLTDLGALAADLAAVRSRGYAIDDQELELGIRCVAAPIIDVDGDVLSSIGMTGPVLRLSIERCHEIGADVMAAAAEISRRLRSQLSAPTVRRVGAGSPVTCVQPATAFLGDSPVWDSSAGVLWWVDILAPALHRLDPATGLGSSLPLTGLVSALALRQGGGFVAAAESSFALLGPESGVLQSVGDVEVREFGLRFNDGKCDRQGRFWAGTMSMARDASAACLYRLDPDGRAQLMESGIGTTNGLGWSPDDRIMYLTDSQRQAIFAYDFEPKSGGISKRRLFAEVPQDRGEPGGLTTDADGYVWSANWGGWCITRYAPDGRVDRIVPMPVPRPTSCSFGGPDLKTLYITSARIRLNSAQLAQAPLSGSVFGLATEVGGLEEYRATVA